MNRPYLVLRFSSGSRWRTVSFLFALISAYMLLASPLRAETIDQHLRTPDSLLSTPCPPPDSLLLPNRFYVVCYNTKWRIPHWVAYHLTAPDLEGDVERTEDFRENKAITDRDLRSTLKDYRGSGYHRGHMAPAEAFDRSLISMSTTFLLSNMAPQTPSLNSGKWRSLESNILKVVNAHRGVWVITGNLFADETADSRSREREFESIDPLTLPKNNKRHWIGNGRVAVPTHSFKAVLVARDNNKLAGYGFIMPNQRTRLPLQVSDYQVSIDQVEELTGINVFSALDGRLERRLEADTPSWPPKRERRR